MIENTGGEGWSREDRCERGENENSETLRIPDMLIAVHGPCRKVLRRPYRLEPGWRVEPGLATRALSQSYVATNIPQCKCLHWQVSEIVKSTGRLETPAPASPSTRWKWIGAQAVFRLAASDSFAPLSSLIGKGAG
ncbi:hypothetical protein AAFF_G00166870 [Aldrovandia affinis]|uniref:Uncharacterized protein n=1 Tax=Aldrovandia affinis TaxID=143900 RepID=A0AAD7RLY5_9TELE|nr:hypothetical protein AAFF_G00166870 [Aldrovandia affinis]